MDTIDIFDFSRHRKSLDGDLLLEDLPGLEKMLSGPAKFCQAHFHAHGVAGDKGLPGVELTIAARLVTECVRCGEPAEFVIEKTVPFLFAQTEAQANAMPLDEDGDWEIVVGSKRFDLAHWVEEELILSLPMFPKHENCEMFHSQQLAHEEKVIRANQPKPFADLGKLLKSAKKH